MDILRILYLMTTPYATRSYDSEAHIDYIKFVFENWTIPPAASGWEFHQAPVYYFISALQMNVGHMLGFSKSLNISLIQIGSLLVSIATLGAGIWIASLLFAKSKKTERLIFSSMVACLPALVFLSSRITNNGLYHFFAFLSVALLIKWWKTNSIMSWYFAIATIAISFTVRVSGLTIFAAAGIILICSNKYKLSKLLLHGILSIFLFVSLAGWLPVLRYMEEDPLNSVTFSSQSMNGDMRVPSNIENLISFNPIEIVQKPFNDTWNDEYRRKYFPEFMYKSAFFGEFSYPDYIKPIAIFMLISGMFILIISFIGFISNALKIKDSVFIPLFLVTFFVLLAHLCYRLMAPFSANQDFRFSILLIIPITYWIAIGSELLPKNIRKISNTILLTFYMSCVVFLLSICFTI